MPTDVTPLFRPLKVKGHTIPNRIVLPPMVTNREIQDEDGIDWYAGHAAGGPGLVIVEATGVARFGHDLTVDGLRTLTDAIHGNGALAAIQLFPRPARFPFGTAPVVAEMSPPELEDLVEQYRTATRVCVEAGFDGVEPHGAHNYLLNRFFSPSDNARTDRYGGDLAGRMRLGLEITRACRQAQGDEGLLLYRHTPDKDASYTLEESLIFAEKLVAEGVDILDISPSSRQAPGDKAEPFRQFGVPVIAVGHLDEPDRAVEAITLERADLVAIGRGLIADPNWPKKVRDGRFDEIVECTRCDELCYGNLSKGEYIACTQW